MSELVIGFIIVILILGSLLAIPFLLCRLTEIEQIKNHWWNISLSILSGYDQSVRLYAVALISPLFIFSYFFDDPNDPESIDISGLILSVSCILLVISNREFLTLHQTNKRVMLATIAYVGFIISTVLLFAAGWIERGFIDSSWIVVSFIWGIHVFITYFGQQLREIKTHN